MTSLFSKPKTPKIPEPTPPPPAPKEDSAVIAAQEELRKRRKGARGRSFTILKGLETGNSTGATTVLGG